MTDLEQAVATALRLTTEAATAMLPEIQRNIKTARAELIRSGIAEDIANGDGALVEDAIIVFCQIRMGDESMRDKYEAAFQYQQDNLRKS